MNKKKVASKVLLLFILFLIVAVLTFSLDYKDFTFWLLNLYNKTDKLAFFRQNLLTENRFLVLQVIFLGGYTALSAFIFWKVKYLKKWRTFIKNSIQSHCIHFSKKIISVWQNLSTFEKIVLFVPLVIYISFWWIYGWHKDEIFSYTFLVDRGILVCATYYPGPNNHIAFLLCAAILNKIFSLFQTNNGSLLHFICLKLPATLAATFSLWAIWLFFYRKNQKVLGWLCFASMIFYNGFFFYAAHGRGYSWVVFLFLLSCYTVFKISYNSKRKYWFLWSFCMILGCYTVPTFIYVWFGSLMGLWVLGTNQIHKVSFIVSFFSGLIVLFLYSPILIFNGLSAIISNPWVVPLSFEKWIQEFPSFLWETHGRIGVLAFLSSVALFLYKKEYRKVVIYFWCIAYAPYIVIFFQKVLPFERVFLYRQITEVLMVCFVISIFSENIKITYFYKKILHSILIILFTFFGSYRVYSEYYRYKIETNVYHFAEPLAEKIYHKKPISVLVLEDTYNVFLRYYFRNSDTKIEVLPSENTSYQIIILPKQKSFPFSKKDSLNYSIFYEDDFVKGFEER